MEPKETEAKAREIVTDIVAMSHFRELKLTRAQQNRVTDLMTLAVLHGISAGVQHCMRTLREGT